MTAGQPYPKRELQGTEVSRDTIAHQTDVFRR